MAHKLILLNGPCGIGKSTLATRYADEHPLTLNLDIDAVWSMFGHWREQREIALPLSKEVAMEMARVVLDAGHDVIIPQIVQTSELVESLEVLADQTNATFYEILLIANEDESIERFINRGKKAGFPSGFRPGGTIDLDGRERKLSEMYEAMTRTAESRPQTIRIESLRDDIDATYDAVKQAVT